MPACDEVVLAEDVMPFGHVLLRSARRYPDKEALVFPGSRWTYRELAERAWSVARSLVALGVRRGEHVGVLMTNHPDLLASVFGASLAGAVVVPINARYKVAELDYLVEDADLVALITHDSADDHVDFAALIAAALTGLAESANPLALTLPRHPSMRQVIMMGAKEPEGVVSRQRFEQIGRDVGAEQDLRRRVEGQRVGDPALILYTSGTTSAPRGAILTHEAQVRSWTAAGRAWGTTAADVHFTALPLFHVTALGCATWVLGAGATFVSDYHWDAGRALETMERERVTEFYPAYQPVMEGIVNHERFAATDLSSLRRMNNVAPPEVLQQFQDKLPHVTQVTVYGGTEGGIVTITPFDAPARVRIHTCGSCLPGMELRIVDDDGEPVPAGQSGTIEFRGVNTASGYYNAPQKTAESMRDDGWFTMQDLGVLDEDGNVLFLGRMKETLKVGGENVAPQEIEAQLCTHPAVTLACAVGIPDERLVEVPAAYVELAPRHEATEQELIAYMTPRIASFKVPRLIRFVEHEEWPMSTTKIQRSALRERLLAELGQEPPA